MHDMAIAPSIYYARRAGGFVSAADYHDARMVNRLYDLWVANRRVYGAEKLWIAALDAGIPRRPGPGSPADGWILRS